MQQTIAWLFQIHEPTPEKYAWVAFTFLNIAMMLWLARKRSYFGVYMLCVAISSLFRASPVWDSTGDFMLSLAAWAFGWSLLPVSRSRWFPIAIGVMLLGVLLMSTPMDWPGYSPSRYHARLSSSVGLLALCMACVGDRWTRGEPTDWRAVIAVGWFAVWFLSLVQWRSDVRTHAYWVAYWHVALVSKIGASACLLGWLAIPARDDGYAPQR